MSKLATPPPKPRTDADKGNSQTLFLSLFLLLLAFFILLNSLSTLEVGRSTQVMESVKDAFPSSVRAQMEDGFLSEDPGQMIGEGLRTRLETVFEESLPVVEITADPSGNPMYVKLRAEDVFARTTGRITPAAEDLARRLAPIVAQPPAGSMLFLDIVFGRNMSPGNAGQSSISETTILTASRTVERFAELGLPADRISTGLERGDPDSVRFIFRTRPARAGRTGG